MSKPDRDDSDNLLDRLDRLLTQMRGSEKFDDFERLEGEPSISSELEFAVSTLAKLKYRGYSSWQVNVVYKFTSDGVIRTKTYVHPGNIALLIEYTESEAIAIAQAAALKQLNQSDQAQEG